MVKYSVNHRELISTLKSEKFLQTTFHEEMPNANELEKRQGESRVT